MTNEMIIFANSTRLMDEGVLKGSGMFIEVEDYESGEIRSVEIPEEIHTFAAWKTKGYAVKKGEHAVARFPIWTYSGKKKQDDEEESNGHVFMKTAHFFTRAQVEKICA